MPSVWSVLCLWAVAVGAGVQGCRGHCEWRVQLCEFGDLGSIANAIEDQQPVLLLQSMEMLTNQAVDPLDPSTRYLGFPYYLRLDLSCETQEISQQAVREAYLTGLYPLVTVIFQEPVHPVRQKPQRLEVELSAALLLEDVDCGSELCQLGWYAPMPLLNGTVVYRVLVHSNGLGNPVQDQSLSLNVNGYVRPGPGGAMEPSVGMEVPALESMLSLSDPSRPLYFVEGVSPVLVLGQVPGYKAVLLTASDFTHVALIEVGIESLGVGPLSCPQVELSLTIQDAVATESTLFIRQNQLVYQFIGNYSLLPLTPPPSVYWQRVLQWVCVSRLVPVPMSHDGKEYFFILADGLQRGHTYRAEIADGVVTFKELLDEDGKNTCQHLNSDCQVLWVAHDPVYSKSDILLVEVLPEKGLDHAYVLLGLCLYFTELSPLPRFLPKEDSSGGFVILTGSEHYSSTPLLLRGIEINPFTWTLFLWGNAVLCSNDMGNHYMFFTGFPEDQLIKYFTMSRTGEFAFVTEFEQVWWGQEGVSSLVRVRPSTGWNTFSILQVLSGRESYQLPHSLVSVYYDADKLLQELVYTVDAAGRGSLLKRLLPVPEILSYQHFSELPYSTKHTEASSEFVFPQPCPFFSIRVEEVPPPEPYSRVQHYQAKPPTVLHPPGLQRPTSLAVYQGMLYQLLWLQSSYNRPYGDPVYDTTESWWKNKAMYKDYYFYLASNRLSSDGLYLSMEDYNKVYSSPGALQLPDCIYLDRGGSYNFSLFLTANTTDSLSDVSSRQDLLRQVWLAASVSNGNFIQVKTQRYEVISRGGLLYKVELKDLCLFPGQALSGQGLLSFNMLLRIVHSELQCYEQTESGISFKGESRVPVYVGCPPGQQLVFDITSTLAYAMQLNNQYFDCAKPDPKMPCFYYEDIFYPFFLIQDMVTGESRRFLGGYTLKVVGGGPYSQDNLRLYTEEEVLRYNSQNYSSFPSLVWMMVDDSSQPFNNTEDGFPILQGTVSISWICESNSPCADVLAVNLTSPEFFFLVEASNRGVDMSTYCDYTLQFMIHVHGLPLAPERGLSYMLMSHGLLWAVLFAFCVWESISCGPRLRTRLSSLRCRHRRRVFGF